MSGRFTGMRHVQIKQDLMTKTGKLVRAGVLEEPGWMKVFRRLPPQGPPPKDRAGVPEIRLPTDRLFRIRQKQEDGFMPIYAHGELQSATMNFAERQWDLMKRGVPEADAYSQVEEMQVASRAEALAQVTALTASAKEEGASIPLLLGGGSAIKHIDGATPMEQYSLWQQRIAETPFNKWQLGQQVMLDHWICKTALSWGWEQERYLYEEEFEEEISKLRSALFPELREDEMIAAERGLLEEGDEEDVELDAILEVVDWADPGMNEKMNKWYVSYGKWQTRSFVEPDVSKWQEPQIAELDNFIKTQCLKPTALVGLSSEEAANKVLEERNELFPRLNPIKLDEARVVDVLPPIKQVRKMVLSHMRMEDVPLEIPHDMDDDYFGNNAYEAEEEADDSFLSSLKADSPYEANEGGKAVRSIEDRVATNGTEEEEEYEYEEEDVETLEDKDDASLDEYGRLQKSIEAREKELVRKAARDERWTIRDSALELEIGKKNQEIQAQLRERALNFALPELVQFNTKEIRDSMKEVKSPYKGREGKKENKFKK